MAGRPKKQFESVDAIHTQAASLHRELDQLTPQMHKERAGRGDRLGDAWLSALNATDEARSAIHSLRALLALRAGLGTLSDLEKEVGDDLYDESTNPDQADATEDSVIAFDGDAGTLKAWAAMLERPIELILERARAGWDWESAITTPSDIVICPMGLTTDVLPVDQIKQE